jgi:hypothetical protein
MDSLVERCFLIYTALNEESDVSVIDGHGDSVSYSVIKGEFPRLQLTFPDKNFTRQTPLFQINTFYRTDEDIIFMRTMISGRSLLRHPSGTPHFRKVPVFEIFQIKRELIEHQDHQCEFLALIRGLDFPHYPGQSKESKNGPFVKKPKWYVPQSIKYPREINEKMKTRKQLSSVSDWRAAYREGIEKLLYFIWKCPEAQSGVSLCFSEDEFHQNDVCTYYSERSKPDFKYYFSFFLCLIRLIFHVKR